ncbi:Hypothetical protein NTJ_07394 [Nesidiocoris tenuis]|uniref:Uncharacterized protein n=1 Tax=Nesidiocoris tenuis TaxID=355587 RepID=A0ABN7AQU5_9HEMI|nr:Hypothetical protein NTJ_07394 [Nesidiocoris tenuis]
MIVSNLGSELANERGQSLNFSGRKDLRALEENTQPENDNFDVPTWKTRKNSHQGFDRTPIGSSDYSDSKALLSQHKTASLMSIGKGIIKQSEPDY